MVYTADGESVLVVEDIGNGQGAWIVNETGAWRSKIGGDVWPSDATPDLLDAGTRGHVAAQVAVVVTRAFADGTTHNAERITLRAAWIEYSNARRARFTPTQLVYTLDRAINAASAWLEVTT